MRPRPSPLAALVDRFERLERTARQMAREAPTDLARGLARGQAQAYHNAAALLLSMYAGGADS